MSAKCHCMCYLPKLYPLYFFYAGHFLLDLISIQDLGVIFDVIHLACSASYSVTFPTLILSSLLYYFYPLEDTFNQKVDLLDRNVVIVVSRNCDWLGVEKFNTNSADRFSLRRTFLAHRKIQSFF